jgi:hypothetical protein
LIDHDVEMQIEDNIEVIDTNTVKNTDKSKKTFKEYDNELEKYRKKWDE